MANYKSLTLRCDPLYELRQDFPDLKTKDNINIVATCPFHPDKNPSLSITLAQGKGDAGLYNCPSCGESGTVPNLIQHMRELTDKEKMELFFGKGTKDKPRKKYERPKADDSAAKADARLHSPAKGYSIRHDHYGVDGRLAVSAFRMPKKNRPNDKIPKVMAYAVTADTPSGLLKIKNAPGYAKDVGQLLPYRYEKVQKQEKVTTLVIVEGQSTADSVAERLGDAVGVMAGFGGVNNKRTDWTKLNDLIDQTGAGIILVPDRDGDASDMPGLRMMTRIANQLTTDKISIVLDTDKPKGFDLEDVDWGKKRIVEWLKEHKVPLSEANEIIDVLDEEKKAPPPEPEQPPEPEPVAQKPAKKKRPDFVSSDVSTVLNNGHFSLAGRFESMGPNDRPPFLFFNHVSKNYMVIDVDKIAKPSVMIELCPDVQWWNVQFKGKKDEISKTLAQFKWQPAVHNAANSIARITLDDMLGRGLSYDTITNKETQKKTQIMVFSTGGRVVGLGGMQGKEFDIFSKNLKHRYTHGQRLPFNYYQPRSGMPENLCGSARSLVEAVTNMTWKNQLDGYMMCGFLVSALVGGCLNFRPQLWITGASGTGKTWMTEQLLQPFFGSYMKGTSAQFTKAGVQRMIGSDSLPFIIDEAESRTQNDQKTLDEILSIVRTSTQKSQAQVKANMQNDGVSYYMPRASFILLSNAERLPTHADKNRFVSLSLRPAENEDEWIHATSNVIDAVKMADTIRNYIITSAPHIVKAVHKAVKFAGKDDIIKKAIPESRMRTARVTLLMCALQLEYGYVRSDEDGNKLYSKMREMIKEAPSLRLAVSDIVSDAEEILEAIMSIEFEYEPYEATDYPVRKRTSLRLLLTKIANLELPRPEKDFEGMIDDGFDANGCNRLLENSPARFRVVKNGTQRTELLISYNDPILRRHIKSVAPNHAESNIATVLDQREEMEVTVKRTTVFGGGKPLVVVFNWDKFQEKFIDDDEEA